MSGDPIYTEMIIEYSRNPSNFGKIEEPHIHRHDSNPLCGDSIDLYVNVDGTKITEVKFDGKGCAICMACTSVLTEMIQNKTLDEVKNFQKDELLAERWPGTPNQNKPSTNQMCIAFIEGVEIWDLLLFY